MLTYAEYIPSETCYVIPKLLQNVGKNYEYNTFKDSK